MAKKTLNKKQAYNAVMEGLTEPLYNILASEFKKRGIEVAEKKPAAATKSKKVNEEFVKPEKTLKEKLFGLKDAYEKRCKQEEEKYYAEHRKPILDRLAGAKSMEDLLKISRHMLADGFKYPVMGLLVGGVNPAHATLGEISFMTYDREGSLRASELAGIEKKTAVNDLYVYTYYYSWRWWVAGILRCLFFWQDPYSAEAGAKVPEMMKKYLPKCPIQSLYPDYFKQQ